MVKWGPTTVRRYKPRRPLVPYRRVRWARQVPSLRMLAYGRLIRSSVRRLHRARRHLNQVRAVRPVRYAHQNQAR